MASPNEKSRERERGREGGTEGGREGEGEGWPSYFHWVPFLIPLMITRKWANSRKYAANDAFTNIYISFEIAQISGQISFQHVEHLLKGFAKTSHVLHLDTLGCSLGHFSLCFAPLLLFQHPRFWPSIPWKMEVVVQGAPGFSIISLQTSSRMVSPSHSRPHVPRTQTPWRTVSRCAGEPLRLASPWSRTSRQPLGREKSGLRGSGHGGWGPEECPLNSGTEWDAPGTSVARKHSVENSFEYFELPLVLLLRPRQGWRVAFSEAQAIFAVTAMHKKPDFAEWFVFISSRSPNISWLVVWNIFYFPQ